MLLENRVALITGCSRGIGRAIMERFAMEGACVYANARSEGALEDVEVKYNVNPVYFDVNDKDAAKKCIMGIKKEQGRLDILVNNAGIMRDSLLEMVDGDTVDMIFRTNVFSVIAITQMAAKLMKRQKQGTIINISSIVGICGNAGQTAYSASKGAIATLTKTWAKELAVEGIRVNAIAPGKIDTDLYQATKESVSEDKLKNIGLGRLGKPEEVADAVVFLASDMASYITGEILGVNGGWFI